MNAGFVLTLTWLGCQACGREARWAALRLCLLLARLKQFRSAHLDRFAPGLVRLGVTFRKRSVSIMWKQIRRCVKRCSIGLTGGGAILFQAQGCNLDPDIALRAGISAGSDLAIFLLQNLAASV